LFYFAVIILKSLYIVAALMVKFDLTHYQCPQLFVQFRYQLKIALQENKQNGNTVEIVYLVSVDSDINDIERYLKFHQYTYQIVSKADKNELIVSLIRGNN